MRYAADRIPGASLVELDGVDHGWWVDSAQIVADIEPFLTGLWKRGEWDLVKTNRVLATVMFTDIADSTAKLAEVGDATWRELVKAHHALIRRQLLRYSGREIDTAGDPPRKSPCPGRTSVSIRRRWSCSSAPAGSVRRPVSFEEVQQKTQPPLKAASDRRHRPSECAV